MPAQTVSSAVAKREQGPISLMKAAKGQFLAVLPKSVDVESFFGTMAGALYASPELMRCATLNPDSLYTAMMRCAALGHQPGTDEFYLTPRKGKILGIEGYRGIIERMYRSGAVKSVIVREVCALDKFEYVEGDMDKPRHEFGGSKGGTGADFFGAEGTWHRGPMVGAYGYAILMTGAVSRVVILSRDDIMAVRDASDSSASDYSPWNRLDGGKDHPEFKGRSMWWKTIARRLEPWVPTSAEYRRELMRATNAASEAVAARTGIEYGPSLLAQDDIVDAELVEPPAPEAPAGAVVKDRDTAPAGPPDPDAAAAGPTMIRGLRALLRKIPLGPPADVASFLEWRTGTDTMEDLTVAECRAVTEYLREMLAKHDPDRAVFMIWEEYQQQKQAAGG
jgi:recombination protein RecT